LFLEAVETAFGLGQSRIKCGKFHPALAGKEPGVVSLISRRMTAISRPRQERKRAGLSCTCATTEIGAHVGRAGFRSPERDRLMTFELYAYNFAADSFIRGPKALNAAATTVTSH